MEWLWIIIAVVVVIAIIIAIIRANSRWTVVESDAGARIDRIYRLEAYLKAQGVKSTTSPGVGNTIQLKVLKKDAERAKALSREFEQEV
ncbi:hypothetical protein [Paenibacillus eucommiae]|uniref:Uncharacterized protein n=1 Tax=Paenibacillus eucommiae TaxID=1355755 RepID=A0ABS4IWU1_9BACL|nr:hypothetical protein [Paenibacillus eucommiae]MBP1992062.1 hypothetical protein [Paenibacillus eucommiae]